MTISLFAFAGLNASFASPKIGGAWRPKQQNYMVGRDVNTLTQTSPVIKLQRDVTLAEGDETRLISQDIFNIARNMTARGFQVKNFRSVATEKLEDDSLINNNGKVYESKTHTVFFKDNTLTVCEKDEQGRFTKNIQERVITEDTRLVWDSDGSPQFKTGSDAYDSTGALKAETDKEILVRVSGRNVEAGSNTTVINLSTQAGSFSGGSDVTYLGAYTRDMTIASGKNTTTYAGYFNGVEIRAEEGKGTYTGVFEDMTIDAGNLGNIFSGYFSSSTINGGNSKDTLKGMFLSGCAINGGDGDDNFTGRFIDSALDGGAGNDSFGYGISLADMRAITRANGQIYNGLDSDFVDSTIDGGDGDDTFNGSFWDSSISLGKGNDQARGVFSHSALDAGEGDDLISAMYSDMSTFETGAGNDTVALATSRVSRVQTGEGANSVTLGYNEGVSTGSTGADYGGDAALENTTWSTPDEYASKYAGVVFGQLQNNIVDASVGENAVHVNHGTGAQSVWTGTEGKTNAAPANVAPAAAYPASVDDPANAVPEKTSGNGEARPGAAQQNEEDAQSAAASVQDMSLIQHLRGLAAKRYADTMGEGPEQPGGAAAKVITGAGEDIAMQAAYKPRKKIAEPYELMQSFFHRYNGYSNSAHTM